MEALGLIPTEDSVVFPGMTVTLAREVGVDDRVFLVPRSAAEFASVGTVARVVERAQIPGGGQAVVLEGLHRGVGGAAAGGTDGALRVEVAEHRDEDPQGERVRELEREYRAVVEEILELREADPRIEAFIRSITSPGALADTAGFSPDLSFEQKRELLETLDVTERLEKAVAAQRERLAELQVRKRIRDDVESGAQRQQREYFLRKQLESIRRELGDDEGSLIDDYRRQIDEAGMPDSVREQAERGVADERGSGAILTLIGPPGTGKTSIGESVARATGREFVRMSLGGIRDEAEIRGHRRTYIGALPGRLVRALRDAGTMNPVIMLDEVDKV